MTLYRHSFGVASVVVCLLTLLLSACAVYEDAFYYDHEDNIYSKDKPPYDADGDGLMDTLYIYRDAERQAILLTDREHLLTAEGNAFAARLLGQLCEGTQENVVLSPFSVQLAMGLLANGMGEDACRELLDVMYDGSASVDELNRYLRLLYEPFTQAADGTVLTLPNSMWVQSGYGVVPAFVQSVSTFYDARISYVDFVNDLPASSGYISHWMRASTCGQVDHPGVPLSGQSRLLLLNGCCLRTAWTTPFIPSASTLSFTCADGTVAAMPGLCQVAPVYTYGLYEKVTFPLGNGSFALTLVLPQEGVSLDSLIPSVGGEPSVATADTVLVCLPPFQLTGCHDLVPVLRDMGVTMLFDGREPLCNMNAALNVTDILQEMCFGVNAAGTDTAVQLVTTCDERSEETLLPMLPAPKTVVFDRPFLFIVTEQSTGTILIEGCVNKPVTQ